MVRKRALAAQAKACATTFVAQALARAAACRSRRTMVHLTALVESPDHVCCRYVWRPSDFLERAGTPRMVALPRRWWDRVWLYRRLQAPTWCCNGSYCAWELAFCAFGAPPYFRLRRRVFHRDSYAARDCTTPGDAPLRCHGSGRDAVIAGNAFSRARRPGPGRSRVVVPTV